jgi:hypothetical protein
VPPIAPATVNKSALFTATVAREFVPGPLRVRVWLFDPVSVPERVVENVVSVVMAELAVTLVAPDVVTLPVAWRVPPPREKPAVAPPILEAAEIERVPALTVVPPLYVLVPVKVSVPVPVLVRFCVPPITPATVNRSALLTATVAREFVPGPFRVRVWPFDPVIVPERVVEKVASVVMAELVVTLVAPDVVTLPVA